MRKIIVNLGCKNTRTTTNPHSNSINIQNLLLMSIVVTPEKDISHVDRKLDKRKIRTSSIKSSSILFS